MNYCKECGCSLSDTEQFCRECGKKVALPNREAQHSPRQKWSLKKKLALVSTVVVIILLITGYKIGSAMTSKEKAVENFQAALNRNDAKALQKLLFSTDPKLKINSSTLKPFIAYLKKNPDKIKGFVKTAKAQAAILESSSSKYPYSGTPYEDSPFILKKNGTSFMLFNHYQFQINPFYLTLSTNYNKAGLYVNNKKVATASSDDYSEKAGPYILGIYHTESRLKNKYTDLIHNQEIVLDGSEGRNLDSNLDLEGAYFTLENHTEATGTFLLNGKSTGLDINDVNEIGPLNMDGSTTMQVTYNLPWGKVTSKPIAIDSNVMSLDVLPVSDDQKKIIIKVVSDYEKSWADTESTRSIDKLKHASPSYIDEVSQNLKEMKDQSLFWSGKFVQETFDLDSFNLTTNDNGDYVIECLGNRKYNEATYYEGDVPSLEDDEAVNSYSLLYNSDKKDWMIASVSSSWSDLSNHVQTVKNSDAKTRVNSDGSIDQDALNQLIDSYEMDLIDAINQNNFNAVEGDLTTESSLYNDQKKLVEYLNKIGTTESIESYEVKNIKSSNDNFLIDVDEKTLITDSEGKTNEKTFKWEYTAEGSNGEYTLSKITKR